MSRLLAPLLLLLGFGVAYAANTFGGTMLGFDDHPGQLYRAWHVVTNGPAPWMWNRGWWAGYPELQFYPPGAAYLAALIAWPAQGVLSLETAYLIVLWLTYLLPGVTTYLAVARLAGNGWVALPAGFVALTLVGGIASGVEGGVHIGMIGARLGWALLPVLLWVLVPWIDGDRAVPAAAPFLLAAIVLLHPAQLPTAVGLVILAACWRRPRRPRALQALAALGSAAALGAFWWLPLLARLAETRALAWGTLSAAEVVRPLPLVLLGLAAAGLVWRLPVFPSERVALWWLPAATAITLFDRFALEPLGLRFLPSDRVVDGAWMALIIAASVSGARLAQRLPAAVPLPALAAGAILILTLLSLRGATLALRMDPEPWPPLRSIERGLRLLDFWTALGRLPDGRALFVRSGVPLVHGTDWWRPHTHATALTPLASGRDIVHGTFTHPSPLAALVYRGDAGRDAIVQLAEQLDGRVLFGEPLHATDPERFAVRADRLGIVAVVALEDDVTQLAWLPEQTAFRRRIPLAPFVIFARDNAIALPTTGDGHTWRITLAGEVGAWVPVRMTYYPLWRADGDGGRLEKRRGEDGLLEVRLTQRLQTVTLRYGAGVPEILGVAVTAAALVAWAVAAFTTRA